MWNQDDFLLLGVEVGNSPGINDPSEIDSVFVSWEVRVGFKDEGAETGLDGPNILSDASRS